MAKWQVAEIVVRLKSDLHCGTSPLGFIARTLPFVPAHIPFYALVPVVARILHIPEEKFPDLEDFLAAHFRFSPFFVFEHGKPLYPWKSKDLLTLEKRYLASFYGVALDYNSRGALENRLFEKEVILAISRKQDHKKEQRTVLKGYVFWCEGENRELKIDVASDAAIAGTPFTEVVMQSQWGGEVNKGLGRLLKATMANITKIFDKGEVIDTENNSPVLQWPPGDENPFYLKYDETINNIKGRLMPLTGRRYDRNRGPGVKMDDVLFVWDCGWQMSENARLLLGTRCVNFM